MQAPILIQPEGEIGAHIASFIDPSGDKAARGEGAAISATFSDEQLLFPGLPLLATDAEPDQAAPRRRFCEIPFCNYGTLQNSHLLGGAWGLEGA